MIRALILGRRRYSNQEQAVRDVAQVFAYWTNEAGTEGE